MNIEPQTSKVGRRPAGNWLVWSVLGVVAAGMILSVSSGAQETNNFPPLDSFKIIRERNIFDPNRYRMRDDARIRTPTKRVDAFALVGTMSYVKGQFAFFDGSNLQYKKVLEPGGIIAGYTVKEIGQDAVTLAANGKEFQMKIGTQMRNQGNNKWLLAGHIIDDTPDETNGDANAENASAESSAAPTGGNPEESDILKKMAERRKQELQQ